jgi:serine/threonine protein kinase
MKDFSHKNILTLMGVALDSRHTPCLVMPFMSNGSLCEYLRKEDVRKELLWDREQPLEIVVSDIYTLYDEQLLCFLLSACSEDCVLIANNVVYCFIDWN